MKTTTAAYKRIIASGGSRNFLVNVDMTLTDGTRLTLTEEDIWADSFSVGTASSGKSSLDIGYAVIGQCSFQIENFDERFNPYDFFNASAVVWVKLEGDTQYYRMGFFTVDEPEHNGILISLILLNNMWKFDDKNLSEVGLSFPCSCQTAITTVCAYCGVTLATSQFHGYQFTLTKAPEKDMNCREFIQYVAMIGCNFCIIDDTGALRLKWYDVDSWVDDLDGGTFDTHTTPYSDGDTADGGNFLVYEETKDYDGGSFLENTTVAYFTRIFGTPQIGTDEITVTGVKIEIDETTYMVGTEGYVIDLKENPLLTASNVNAALNLIWDVLRGFRFRTFDITTLPDLAVEIGDCCAIRDAHGNYVHSYITNNSFGFSNHQVSLGAITPMRSLVKQYSKTVQAAVEIARKRTDEAISTYDVAVQLMNTLAINAMGAYQDYEDLETGGRVYYLSNRPITKVNNHCSFVEDSTVFKATGDGFFVSTHGGQEGTWENGYDPTTGTLLVNVLKAIGVSADWVETGLLTDRGHYNYWDLDNNIFRLSATTTVGGKTVDAIAQEKADAAEQAAENTAAAALAAQVAIYDADIADLQNQIDGNVTTWYYSGVPTLSNPPANQWTTTTDKDNHIGDIYYDSDTGYAYRFMKDGNNYVWTKISDSDIEAALAEAQDAWDLADNKRRVFITQPVPPYDIGDLWVQGSNGDIKRCATAKTDTQTYNASDWVLASKYTDDSALTSWISGTYTTDKTNLQSQIDSKAETWYQSADPSSAWTTEALKNQHIGDLWYKTTDDTTWYYTKDGSTYKWVQQNVPTEVFDKIDGKAHIYTSQPTTPYHVGDLWFASTSSEIKVCITERLSGNYTASDWAKRDKYTDDSAFTSFRDGTYASFVTATNTGIENAQNTANSKIVTYYQASAPSTHSTGDLWIDTDDGNKLYRWNGSSWANVQDSGIQSALTAASNAQTTADGKIVTFAQASAPTATDVGDLWIDTDDNNKMYRWNGSSWVALSDSSSLVAWVSATYTTDKTNLQNQIDGKAETWYQANDPSTNWSASEKTKHTGDLWYKTSDDTTWYYTGTQWVQQNVPTAVFDKIDGKAQIFTSQPTPPYNVGDLWCVGTTGDILTCVTARATGNYTASDWAKRNKYTDDTAVDNLDNDLDQDGVFGRLTNGDTAQGIVLVNNKLYINGQYIQAETLNANDIKAGVIADKAGKFSLNMTTGALTMNSGMFKGQINVNNNFLVNSSGDMTAKSGSFGVLKINSNDSSIYAEGILTLMDDNIILNTSGADRRYKYDLIIDTAYFSSDTYINYTYYTLSGANGDYLGTVSLYRYYTDGSIGSRLEYTSIYAVSNFSSAFSEHMYANNGMYLLRFSLNYKGFYRSLNFKVTTTATLKSLLFSSANGIVAPTIRGSLSGKVQASDFSCGSWRFEGLNKRSLIFGEVSSSEDYVRLDVFYGLTINYSVQNLRMNVGLKDISRVENGVTWYAQFYQGSDRRIKENIKPIDTDLSVKLIDKTEPKSFTFIHDKGTHYGMIAQEARAVLDELGEEDAKLEHELDIPEMPVENMRTIEYVEYIPHLINYVKDLRAEIESLKEEIKSLKEEK